MNVLSLGRFRSLGPSAGKRKAFESKRRKNCGNERKRMQMANGQIIQGVWKTLSAFCSLKGIPQLFGFAARPNTFWQWTV